MPPKPDYLKPYLKAVKTHGGSFPALLWASRETQHARFHAFSGLLDFSGLSVLDVGCGRADLFDYMVSINQHPAEYLGIEAVPALADAAQSAGCRIIREDFIEHPQCMFTGSDVVLFSGSLNTATDPVFYATLRRAFDATAKHLVFNFLSSSYLAGAKHLYWRKPDEVDRFCRNVLSVAPTRSEAYLGGDATFLLTKSFN